MSVRRQQIEQQIAELTENLGWIEVRKSQYVQPTDIPLQLERDEADLRQRLAELQAELAALPAPGSEPELEPKPEPESARRSRWPAIGLLAGALLLVAGAAIWFTTRNAPAPATPTLAPASPTAPAAATAAAATGTPAPPATLVSAPLATATFAPLPDLAPQLTTTVVLVQSPLCPAEQEILAGAIREAATDTPPLLLQTVPGAEPAAEGRAAVRQAAAEAGADLAIWCTGEGGAVVVHFELLTQRAAPDVYEPPTLSAPATPRQRLQHMALGAAAYQRRDYAAAASLLQTAVAMSPEAETSAALKLLIGNTEMFRRDYAAAAATYAGVTEAQPTWAFAWHNLGVARLYAAWRSNDFDAALAALAQARTLDPAFDLPLIAQARIDRLLVNDITDDSFDKAVAACDLAQRSADSRTAAQGLACASQMRLIAKNLGQDGSVLQSIDLDALPPAATQYWADPLAIAGFVEADYWSANQDALARRQARAWLVDYLQAASDDVNLEESRWFYRDALRVYLPMLDQ